MGVASMSIRRVRKPTADHAVDAVAVVAAVAAVVVTDAGKHALRTVTHQGLPAAWP